MIKKDHEGVVLCMTDLRNIWNFDFKTLAQKHSLLLRRLFTKCKTKMIEETYPNNIPVTNDLIIPLAI